jgi:hypothetical protein
MCVVKGVVKREPKTKQEIFWTDFVRYHVSTDSYLSTSAIEPWQIVLRLRGSLINRPISELNDRLEDYLEAAYSLGEVAGFTEALRLLYELGLAKDYLELPRTSERLQRLAFELYWLTLRIERTKIRRNESLAQKAAKLNYGFYRLFERALKAACAHR